MPATTDEPTGTRFIGRLKLESGVGWMRLIVPRTIKPTSLLCAILLVPCAFLTIYRALVSPHDVPTFILSIVFAGILLIVISSSATRQVITIRPPVLGVRRELFGIAWTRHYPLDQLSNLQFRHQTHNAKSGEPSCITFDYEYQPRRCALDITVAEAAELIPLIKSQFPDLVARSSTSSGVAFDDPQPVGRN